MNKIIKTCIVLIYTSISYSLLSQSNLHYEKIGKSDILYCNEYSSINAAFLIGEEIWFSTFQGKIGVLKQDKVNILYDVKDEVNWWSTLGDSLVSFSLLTDEALKVYIFNARTHQLIKVCKLGVESMPFYSVQLAPHNRLIVCFEDKLLIYDYYLGSVSNSYDVKYSVYWNFFTAELGTFIFGFDKCYYYNHKNGTIDEIQECDPIIYNTNSNNYRLVKFGTMVYAIDTLNIRELEIDDQNRLVSLNALAHNNPMAMFSLVGLNVDSSASLLFLSDYKCQIFCDDNVVEIGLFYSRSARKMLGLSASRRNNDSIRDINESTLILVERIGNAYYFIDSNGIIFKKKLSDILHNPSPTNPLGCQGFQR